MTDSDYLALHNQELVDVMVETDRCGDHRSARILHDLAEGGHAFPLDEKELGPLRQEGKVLEHSIWALPVLTDLMPPEIAPDTNQVKEILLNNLAGANLENFYPPGGSRSENELVLSNLINNIDNPRYRENGAISHLRSPELERIYRYTPDWHQDGILWVSKLYISLDPAGSGDDIKYSDVYMHSTLITGSKIWLVFRPTSNNMAVVQAYYNSILNGRYDYTMGVALDRARDFEPGIILIQRAGQTLILPPFWMAITLSTQPTVSAEFGTATATKFAERIKQLRNFRFTNRLHLDDDDGVQETLFIFTDRLIEQLRAILEGNFPECNLNQVIINICRGYETFRADLRRVFEAIEDKTIVQGLEDKWRAAWINFLDMKRKNTHRPHCRLCKLPIRDMPAGTSTMDRLRQHFIGFH